MDYEAQACMDETCAPVFQYFRTAQSGTFHLEVSDKSSHRRRMLEVYIRYTLGALLGMHRYIHTEWTTPEVLSVQVQLLSHEIPAPLSTPI